jgi:hypothetical protein
MGGAMSGYLSEMAGGPGELRFFVQPLIAVVLGIRHGVADRQAGRPPYLIGLLRAHDRLRRLGEGLRQILVPLCVAVAASLLFQWVIRARVHVLIALVYAAIFVALPYFLTRAAANRVAEALPHRRA